MNDVLADDRATPEERAALADLASRLRLPDELARRLYGDAAGARVRARLREAIADRRFSVHEAQELGQLASSLGVQVEMDKATRSALERFAPLWKFENWKLPIVTAPIALGQGEVCHFSCAALPG